MGRPIPSRASFARPSANFPTPMIISGSMSSTIFLREASQTSKRSSRSWARSLSGVRFLPDSSMKTRGQKFQTKKRSKKASASGNASAAQPQSRRPETSLRAHAKPVIGRFGCSIGGCPTGSSIPIQSLTAAISPKGTPVWAMP